MLPALANVLGDEIYDVIHQGGANDNVEFKIIVEGDHGKTISIEYKGPPGRAVDTMMTEAARHLPAITGNVARIEQASKAGEEENGEH